MLKRMLFSLTALSLVAACSTTVNVTNPGKVTDVKATDNKVSGETKKYYDGDVTTWAKLDDKKAVSEFGFTIPLKTVENSPTDKDAQPTAIFLNVPAEVKNTTVIHILNVGFNPQGHEPANIYTLPHYDFHLYSLTEDEVKGIDCKDETLPAADSGKVPPNYIFAPPPKGQCVPLMGFHGVDVTSPELNQEKPAKFDKTMILGFYKGSQNFIEPMITKELLMSKQDFSMPIAKPAKYGTSSLYPTMLNVSFDKTANAYNFVFTKFEAVS
jgi:hypothetical protein